MDCWVPGLPRIVLRSGMESVCYEKSCPRAPSSPGGDSARGDHPRLAWPCLCLAQPPWHSLPGTAPLAQLSPDIRSHTRCGLWLPFTIPSFCPSSDSRSHSRGLEIPWTPCPSSRHPQASPLNLQGSELSPLLLSAPHLVPAHPRKEQ